MSKKRYIVTLAANVNQWCLTVRVLLLQKVVFVDISLSILSSTM